MQDNFNKYYVAFGILGGILALSSIGVATQILPSAQEIHATLVNEFDSVEDRPKAFADSGSAAEIAFIKSRIPVIITTDTALCRFSAQQIRDSGWLESKLTGPEVPTQVRKVWVPEMVDSRVADIRAGFELVASEPDPATFTDNRFVVTRWLGVSSGNGAGRAVFDGHHEYLVEDGWLSNPDSRWEIEFELVGEGLDARLLLRQMAGYRNAY